MYLASYKVLQMQYVLDVLVYRSQQKSLQIRINTEFCLYIKMDPSTL